MLKTSIFIDTAVSYMLDMLDQLQLLAGCEYLSDMRVIPYINEQAKQKLLSLSPTDYPLSQWEDAVPYLFDFSDIPADDFVD